jgi:hypothetical protein
MTHEDYKPFVEARKNVLKVEADLKDVYEQYLAVATMTTMMKQRGHKSQADVEALWAAVSAASDKFWQSRGVLADAARAAERNK